MLNDEVPLIGFRFTLDHFLLCVEGKGSKSFDTAKVLFSNPIAHSITKNHRYNYSIFKKKSKSGVKRSSNF
jgi:hypothetical protein